MAFEKAIRVDDNQKSIIETIDLESMGKLPFFVEVNVLHDPLNYMLSYFDCSSVTLFEVSYICICTYTFY